MTIEEIARHFGVSKSTVSRALSGKGRLSPSTREKIRSYAGEHGVAMNEDPTASGELTNNIGVVIPADAYTTNTPFFQEVLLGISEAASTHNFHVVIATGSIHDISDVKQLVERRRVDAMILLRNVQDDKAIDYLASKNFPTGLSGVCEYDEIIQLDTNNYEASESLSSILIGRGFRRFTFVIGNKDYQVNMDRYDGFARALTRQGLSVASQQVFVDFIDNSVIDDIIEAVKLGESDCIVCGDDVICVKLLSRLQAEGYRIPQDIAIASLYNSSILDFVTPAITAVSVSARLVGNQLAKQVINRCLGNPYSAKTLIDYEILFRRSTEKPYAT